MNYYPHHIGDFNNATRHLTRVERSMYRDAIELYYDTEMPLVCAFAQLSRRLIAHSDDEKDALKYILDEFFTLTDDGYVHARCEREIDRYKANNSAKARAGKASAEARRKKHEGKQKKKDAQKQQVFNTCSTQAEQNPTNQEPITNNQEPITNKKTSSLSAMDELFEIFWLAGMRKVDKKRARSAFNRVLKPKEDQRKFVNRLVIDIKTRLSVSQSGFNNMHPTTYLNNERWTDEISSPVALLNNQPNPTQRSTRDIPLAEQLSDTSWADDGVAASTGGHSDISELVMGMISLIQSINPSARGLRTDHWLGTVSAMLNQDHRKIDEIVKAWGWAANDHFWTTKILNIESFRKNFDQLIASANQPQRMTKRDTIIQRNEEANKYDPYIEAFKNS